MMWSTHRMSRRWFTLSKFLCGVLLIQLCVLYFLRSGELEDDEVETDHFRPRTLTEYQPFRHDADPSTDTDYPFSNYDPANATTDTVTLTDSDAWKFFTEVRSTLCFTDGTDVQQSVDSCVCRNDWFGDDCGIPAAAWFGYYQYRFPHTGLVRRSVPRRIIQALNVNHELEMFEARVAETGDVTDVFVIGESNFTVLGEDKNLTFLQNLQSGWLRGVQGRILYILQDVFPDQGSWNGWFADRYMRTQLSQHAVPRLIGTRDSDLFFMFDSDELPSHEILTFLKLYDGYMEPLEFLMKWNVFGFYWKRSKVVNVWGRKEEEGCTITAGCTMAMLREVFHNDASLIRSPESMNVEILGERVAKYRAERGALVGRWTLGAPGYHAGFHCSYCFRPEGIRTKLVSAQRHDKPRWGDYPEKLRLEYISQLIRDGEWFDGTKPFIREKVLDKKFAPKFFLQNPERFQYLLEKPK